MRALALGFTLCVGSAGTVAAQACAGVPLEPRAWAAGVLAGAVHEPFGEEDGTGGLELGVTVSGRPVPGVSVEATVARRDLSGTGADPWAGRAEARAALDRVHLLRSILSRLPASVCFTGGLGVIRTDQDRTGTGFTTVAVPVGLAIGRAFDAGESLELAPFVATRLLWTRVDGRVLRVPVDRSQVRPGVAAGIGVRYGRVFAVADASLTGVDAEVGNAPWPERLATLRIALRL